MHLYVGLARATSVRLTELIRQNVCVDKAAHVAVFVNVNVMYIILYFHENCWVCKHSHISIPSNPYNKTDKHLDLNKCNVTSSGATLPILANTALAPR